MTLDEKIVGAVARAIYEDRNGKGCKAWAHQPKVHQAPYLSDARAAITAYQAEAGDTWLADERTGTLYQVIGSLADAAGVFEDPAVTRALDLAAYGKTEDGKDVLPFAPDYPAPKASP